MKTTLRFILILLTFITLVFVPNSPAQDTTPENVVRVIYFIPNDREPDPDIDTKLDTLIKDVQQFYADEMERHGFGRKTFRLETDTSGKVVVHRINGLFSDADYQHQTTTKVREEVEQLFDFTKNIHFIAVNVSTELIGNQCGIGGERWNIRDWGGYVLIPASGNCFARLSTSLHELGHTFGLNHDFHSDTYIMSYGGESRNEFSTCAAEWLNNHRYFNTNQTTFNRNTDVRMLTPRLVSPPNTIRLQFELTDPDGLYQVQLLTPATRKNEGPGSLKLIGCKQLTDRSQIVKFITTEFTEKITADLTLSVMDKLGSVEQDNFSIDISTLLPSSKIISIPDQNLAAAIRKTLGLTPNSNITQLDMLKLTNLQFPENSENPTNPGHQISDLTGLEYATNLKQLNLWNNQIRDITPITRLTKLTDINLSNNQISGIAALTKLTRLQTLTLDRNQISDINPLIGLTQLRNLYLWENQISNISSLAGLTQLRNLYLWKNQINDIRSLAGLTQLRNLYLWKNQISDIRSLAGLTKLERLWLSENKISDLKPLTELTMLRELTSFVNQISDLKPLAGLTKLERLWLDANQISDVSPLAGLTNLHDLWLGWNQISDVRPLAGLTNLKELILVGNPIKNRKPLFMLLRKNPGLKIYLKNYDELLPVTLSHFRAELTDAGVILKWTTESEVDNAGFYIYRSETKDGEFKVVNPTMIQGAGTTGERNEYTWTDTTAKPNTVYYYRIEDVSHAGVREQFAAVRLRGLISAKGKLTTRWADLKAEH